MSAASEALVPAWLLEMFPALQAPIDPTAYEERVARMVHGGGLPESWVRAGLADLQGGDWQDRVLLFADRYAQALASNGWGLGDLFPPDEIKAPQPQLRGVGWALIDALEAGGRVTGANSLHVFFVDGNGRKAKLTRP